MYPLLILTPIAETTYMSSAIKIIEEIKQDAGDLQKKLLSVPNTTDSGYTRPQTDALIDAQELLAIWRRTLLNNLKKVFQEGG